MDLIYNTNGSVNGFDSFGHTLRSVVCRPTASTTARSTSPAARPSTTRPRRRRRRRRRARRPPIARAGDQGISTGQRDGRARRPHAAHRSRLTGDAPNVAGPPATTSDLLNFLLGSMSPRPNRGNLAASPTTVGAITVLIVVVAVFLAYNANHGLPFVPTYKLSAEVPNAANLVDGNDVRIAGVRVGTVTSITPVQGPERVHERRAQPDAGQVDRAAAAATRRSRSATPRRSGSSTCRSTRAPRRRASTPATAIPISQDHPQPVDLDQFFNTFDTPTREASQTNLRGFGDALAGRGGQLNGGITALRQLVDSAQPLVHNLAAPSTGFGPFFSSLESISRTVAPVALQQADLFAGLDATFGAFARVARPYLQDSIAKGAPTEDAAIHSFPVIRPFLDHSATFFTDLQPGINALANSAPNYATGLRLGVPALARLGDLRPRAAGDLAIGARLPEHARGDQRARISSPTPTTPSTTRSPSSPPRRRSATTSPCSSATSPRSAARATASAPGRGWSPSPPRRGRTTSRARPAPRPTARRRSGTPARACRPTTCTTTPTRTPPLPARPASARPATSPTRRPRS